MNRRNSRALGRDQIEGSQCVRTPGQSGRMGPRPSSRTRRTACRSAGSHSRSGGPPSPPSLQVSGMSGTRRSAQGHCGRRPAPPRAPGRRRTRRLVPSAVQTSSAPAPCCRPRLSVSGEDDHQPGVAVRQQAQRLGVHPPFALEPMSRSSEPSSCCSRCGAMRGRRRPRWRVRYQHDQRLGAGRGTRLSSACRIVTGALAADQRGPRRSHARASESGLRTPAAGSAGNAPGSGGAGRRRSAGSVDLRA